MILVSGDVERHIRAEGEKWYPDECCGFLLGQIDESGRRRVEDILPVPNAGQAEERHHRFRIEPDDFMRAERQARLRGLDVIGFYHSHPDHPATPSEYDREQALPFYSYVILSVRRGASAEISSWELSGDRALFNHEELECAAQHRARKRRY
ncbi:MAG: M67 family metallopeptidase [Desulfovibrio sp.]|jgi:proteasome lid subunit RPN8/RPN11|nr:M67 family metallopeptidase [Desulfovibrio sp.]